MADDNKNKTPFADSKKKKRPKKEGRQFMQIPIETWAVDAWMEMSKDTQWDRKFCLELMVEEFIKEKSEYLYESPSEERRFIVLKVAALGAKARSIWLDAKTYTSAETFAKVIPANTNRVVYTALIEGLEKRKYIRL